MKRFGVVRSISLAVGSFCAALVFIVNAFAMEATPAGAADAHSVKLTAPPAQTSVLSLDFHVSDRLKLSFYERLDTDEDRWRNAGGKAVQTPRDFHERTEISGEYVVQDDGSISLPLLGRFNAVGQSNDALLRALKASFEDLIGRKGFVNLLAVEHRPIYIVGPVKSPGAFAFEPGLTPLHAIALAGGLRQEAVENWQQVEAGRQMEELQKSLEHVKRMITKSFVLKAERDGDGSAGQELIGLVGQSDMKELTADERAQRQLVDMSRKEELTALRTTVENARSELSARTNRVAPYDEEAKLLGDRVKGIQQLVQKGIVGKPMLIQAQASLSEVEDRRSQAEVEVEAAKDKLAQASRELTKAQTEAKIEIARAIAASEQDTGDAVAASEGALNIMRTIAATQRGAVDVDNVVYEIVRRRPDGAVTIKASDMSNLEPGDLVRVRLKKDKDDSQLADQ